MDWHLQDICVGSEWLAVFCLKLDSAAWVVAFYIKATWTFKVYKEQKQIRLLDLELKHVIVRIE